MCKVNRGKHPHAKSSFPHFSADMNTDDHWWKKTSGCTMESFGFGNARNEKKKTHKENNNQLKLAFIFNANDEITTILCSNSNYFLQRRAV